MKLHEMKNTKGARRPRKRVGRGMGSGMGKTSGAGHKGQMARSGHKHKPGFEGGQMKLIRRIPKRGFTKPNPVTLTGVNVGSLECFESGTEVTSALLLTTGLAKGSRQGVKILGEGTLTRKLTVKVQAVSASAKAKIEQAGGTVETASVR
ncbi:MAG: 50S ribosomal protein L15 [Kiritimatiellia bacterium]